MDPLSVTASIVGILGAAAKVSSLLINFVQSTKGAPKVAQAVLAEVNGLSAVLTQLQAYLLGAASSSKSRASLILVEQIIVTLAECVTTFSELEDVLGTAGRQGELDMLDRMKWAMKESKVVNIQVRLQSNKASLTLMLTILQCKSMDEAESAMTRLCDLVEQVLVTNQEMNLRLRNLDGSLNDPAPMSGADDDPNASITSSRTASPPPGSSDIISESNNRTALGFAFEEDLLASRVYRKPLYSKSGESLVTSAARTTASSVLSALSLTDISNISILAVPIYAHEISNSARYTFGDFMPEASDGEPLQAATQAKPSTSVTNKWNRFASTVWRQRQAKAARSNAAEQSGPIILGLPLVESLRCCNVAISLSDGKGGRYVYGYIPFFVAKTAIFLKERATDVENIFSISGSARRLRNIEVAFNTPPRYGKGFDWTGYTVHDAASILLRFLFRLPESVIPVDRYETFQQPMNTSGRKNEDIIRAFQRLIVELPPLSRQLLLYLLDLLAVLASKADLNKMTTQRLAAVFQSVILSPIKTGDEYIEEATSRQLSQDVLIFLIEYQDHFLIDMAGPEVAELEA